MNVRLILGYIALCAGLSAYDVRGFSGLWFYAFGLAVCLLAEPAHRWMERRRAFINGLKQFERDAQQARLLAAQQFYVGGNY